MPCSFADPLRLASLRLDTRVHVLHLAICMQLITWPDAYFLHHVSPTSQVSMNLRRPLMPNDWRFENLVIRQSVDQPINTRRSNVSFSECPMPDL